MSYEFSWNLLESTFDKVSDVLGDTISDNVFDQEAMDQFNSSETNENILGNNMIDNFANCENPMIEHNNCEVPQIKSVEPEITDKITEVPEEIVPQGRSRSNSWPRRKFGPQSGSLFDSCQQSTNMKNNLPLVSEEETLEEEVSVLSPSSLGASIVPKKHGRRNPWGSYSYSDIIVQAISTAPEQRMTLNQIYDWMISAIPYFSERQDNASSAGWKNSIRHNLSLHQKFIKIPNEDPGKSSWWKINHEIKQANKPRRRATYGDSKSFQIKRDKAKKRVEALRNNGRLERTSSMNWLPPLSPLNSVESCRNHSTSSASSCDDLSLSSFRSRSFSNSSNTSQTSPLHLPELSIPSLHQLIGDANVETDLDDIRLDDLNIGSAQDIPDPAEIIREYLHPSDKEYSGGFLSPNITILEPRDNGTVGNSVIKFAHSNSSLTSLDTPFLSSLRNENLNENHDEERKMMIKNKLNSLIQKRVEITQNQSLLSVDNKKNLESAVVMQIKMLQEEIEKVEKQEKVSTAHSHISDINYSISEESFVCYEGMDFNSDTFYAH